MVESCEYRDKKPEGMYVEMVDCLIRILDYLSHENVDIDRVMAEKIAYNKTRPYRHGNKKCWYGNVGKNLNGRIEIGEEPLNP